MAYCVKDDLLTIMTEEELSLYMGDDALVDEAIEDASSEIDAYLSRRYDTPVSPAPAILKKLCLDITLWNIVSRRQRSEAPPVALERYRAAIRLLEKIARGEITIGPGPAGPEPEGGARSSAPPQAFTREGMAGW